MIYLETDTRDPYENLAAEEVAFTALDPSESYLMLWQNDNTIVVGKFQNTAEEIDQEYVDAHGIRVARRLSGGGAVYHDAGNLNYTLIVDRKQFEDFNFRIFVEPVVRTLARFGVQAECNGRNDVTIGGKKFSGSSQYAKGERLLHHGCIMLDSDLSVVSRALNVNRAKIESKGIKSVSSRVTTVNANAPRPISMAAFKAALTEEIFAGAPVRRHAFTERERAQIETLRREKYSTWDWNYGYCGNYALRREKKFPAGLVTVHMNAEGGHIGDVRIRGDFFGNGDLAELESAMRGLALDEKLEAALEKLNVPHYISGVTAGDLAALLRY